MRGHPSFAKEGNIPAFQNSPLPIGVFPPIRNPQSEMSPEFHTDFPRNFFDIRTHL